MPGGIDAVEVLQVGADIGIAMLHGLGVDDAGNLPQAREQRARRRAGAAAYGHVGAIGQLGVDQPLRLIGGVKERRRDEEGHGQRGQRHAHAEPGVLARKARGDRRRHGGREGGNEPLQQRAAVPQNPARQAQRDKAGPDPEQDRGEERGVVDGGGGDALCGEDNLIAGGRRLPEHDSGEGEAKQIEIEALPERRAGPQIRQARARKGLDAHGPQRRREDGDGREQQSGEAGRQQPGQAGIIEGQPGDRRAGDDGKQHAAQGAEKAHGYGFGDEVAQGGARARHRAA